MMRNIAEGQSFSCRFVVTKKQLHDFSVLSGDVNPLHLDPKFAAAHGMKNCVVYGGLLIAQISKMLGNEIPGPGCLWQNISLQFKSPLFVDEPARVDAGVNYVSRDLKVLRLSIQILRDDQVIALGTVQAGWFE
jgi:acyl dehydratase